MDQNFHLIEKYFRGELSEEELDLFHGKLQNDPAFEQEFRDMKHIREGAKASARMKALSVLQNVEANFTEKETTKINVSMRRLVSIAASLIVIATVSYFAISDRTGGTMSGEEVFATYYEAYPNIVSGDVRGDDMVLNTLAARAYDAYDNKNFSKSVKIFSELLEAEKSASNYFYSGISNLERGNLDIAKDYFNVVMNNYSEMREQSQWYLALTLLKDNSTEDALSNFASLSLRKSKSKIVRNAKLVLGELGVSLDDTSSGTAAEVGTIPEEGELSPDGALEKRRYQFGKVIEINSGQSFRFMNDVPFEDLDEGDLVEFILIKPKRGREPFAIIMANMN